MGCDIHIMCERKDYDGKWVNCDSFMVNPYWHGKCDSGDERKFDHVPVYDDRNYTLFSFLAGVRNYGNNKPFGFDRGIPEDAHEVTKEEYGLWGSDAHTPGYCTLAELKEKISKVKSVHHSGMVSPESYYLFMATGKTPEMWCRWTNQEGWKHLEWDDEVLCFKNFMKAIQEKKDSIFTPSKNRLENDEKFRIVFWFDN